MNLSYPTWVEIDLNILKSNINIIKSKVKNSEVIAVVKANAYGHGAVEVAKAFMQEGIKRFAVANIREAIELRKNNINCDIMILGVTDEASIKDVLEYDLETTIATYDFCFKLSNLARENNKIVKIHIGLDTGMGRIGFRPNKNSVNEIEKIINLDNLEIVSCFSHFSDMDSLEYSKEQLAKYNWFEEEILKLKDAKNFKKNIANSGAILLWDECHYDYVRAGIIQYGYSPSDNIKSEELIVKPTLTWKCKVVHLKEVEKDEYIGYGRNYKTNKKTKIATIPVGYADGYCRLLSNKGKVIINGQLAPIIGNVCMDQCMIDVTHIKNIKLQDEVILLGSDKDIKWNADDISVLTNTINYEVLCLIGRRVPRIYTENKKIIAVEDYMGL